MGKQHRERVKEQAAEVAKLIGVSVDIIKSDSYGISLTPGQVEKLLALVVKKKTISVSASKGESRPRTKSTGLFSN